MSTAVRDLPRLVTSPARLAAAPARPLVRWTLGHALPRGLMRAAARQGDLQGRLITGGYSADSDRLAALADELRALGPLHRARYGYLTAHAEVAREALTSNDLHSGVVRADRGPLAALGEWASEGQGLGPLTPPSLLVVEPPEHTRYRKLVTRVFTVRAVERLRERTQEIADDLLDELSRRSSSDPVDLVETYCALLPVTVIAEVLGVPERDRERVLAFGAAAAPSLDLGLGWRRFRSVEKALAAFETWLDGHLAHLREQPGDDLMSQLVAVQEDGVGLDDAELKATAGLVLAAGFETTVNLLGNGIALLTEHRDQLERLRREPGLWSNAVDEVLRYDPPVLLTGRTAERETRIAGTRVPQGAVVACLLAGANRDPAVFDDPHVFDVTRANARDHLSFSAGRHYCLGAALARMEGEIGLRSLFDRFPDLEVAPGARRRDTRILRGWEVLPARLG